MSTQAAGWALKAIWGTTKEASIILFLQHKEERGCKDFLIEALARVR